MLTTLQRRLIIWTAVLAVLFSALSPAFAAGRYLLDPVAAAPVCRTLLAAPQAGDEAPVPQRQAAHAIECVFCAASPAWSPDVRPVAVVLRPTTSVAVTVTSLTEPAPPLAEPALRPINPQAPPRTA